MGLNLKKLSVFLISFIFFAFCANSAYAQRFWVSATAGNWGDAINWSTTSGGAGGAGVPGPTDLVTFNGSGVGNCLVNVNPGSVAGITIAAAYTGVIDLNGFTLTTTGPNTFTGGTVNNAASGLAFNTTGLTTFSGTIFNVPLSGTTGRVLFNGGTFNQSVSLAKTANVSDDGTGNNTFASAFTLQNNSASRIRMATTTRDIFNGTVSLTVNSTGTIDVAYGSAVATQFNDNVVVNYQTNTPVTFGSNSGVATMAATKTLTVISGGAGSGNLLLSGMTFASAQTISLTGNATAQLNVRTGTTFNGVTALTAPSLAVAACLFNGPLTLEKTGTAGDNLTGGNTYGSTSNFINSGSGELNIAYTNADTFNGNVQLNNNGASRIQLGVDSPGNVINGSIVVNHNGSTTSVNTILARNAVCTLTINGDVTLNQNNSDSNSGIIVSNEGDVFINGNLTMNSTNGRGILFANGSALGSVTIGNGFSISATAAGFVTGVLELQRVTQLGGATQSIQLGGTAQFNIGSDNIFNGPVDFRATRLTLDNSTFNNSAYIEKSGPVDNGGTGGSVFAGPTTIRVSGSGDLSTTGNYTFNGSTTIESTGSSLIALENGAASIYNGPVTFNNTGSGDISVAHTGNTFFNDNIIVNSTAVGGQILFCETAGGSTATLAAGKTITTTGFSAGELHLARFTQLGNTPQALTFVFPGTGYLRLGPLSTFNGNVTFTAPRVRLDGITFGGTANITKTGGTNDAGTGGNIFMGTTTLSNTGSAYLLTGSTNPDIFNGVLTLNNAGSSQIRLADGAAGTNFNNDIVLNASSGSGIWFGFGGGSSVLANDKTITAGSVINGDIRLTGMVQTSSVNPQVLNLDGIATLTVGPGSQFGGDVDFRAPQLYMSGCIYGTLTSNTIRLEKEGAGENNGAGGNVFHGTTTIRNSGSGQLRTAHSNRDIFNANLTLENASSSTISMSFTAAGNQYNGNITVSNVLGGAGITFGQNNGTSSLTPTGVLAIGPAGFVSGDLRFARFTQTGSLPQTLLLTPPAAGVARLRLGPGTAFGGPIDFRAPRIQLDGATFGGLTYIEKTGASDDAGAGGNVFNGITTLANSGSGWFINADASLDQFNNDLTLTNTGSAGIRMADNIPGTVFRGNIVVNCTFGSGIYFSDNSTGTGTSRLDANKTITVGGLGFSTGDLRLRRMTVLGTNAQAVTLTGAAGLRLGPNSTFNGNVDFRAPQLYIIQGCLYNGTAYLEKTGAVDNNGVTTGFSTFMQATTIRNSGSGHLRTAGGNTFNGPTTMVCSGSNELRLEELSGSIYNGDVEMINDGSSSIIAAQAGTTAFNGNILVNCTNGSGIVFGDGAVNVNLADTKTIAVGATGFSVGQLRLSHFNQLGTGTPQTITLTGASTTLRFQLNTTFNSALTTSSARVFFDGATFNGVNSFTKTGTSTDDNIGGNHFNNTSTFVHNGTGRWRLAGTSADSYNGNMTFTRVASSGALEPAYAGDNAFTGNITISSPAAIVFGAGTGISTFTGTNTQTISKLAAASGQFNRMVVNKASNGITLNTDISIGNSATLTNGIITSTTTNFINFLNGATVTGASAASHVNGPVRKTGTDAFIFPVGKGGIYKFIAIGARAAAGDQFVAEYFNTVQTSGSTMGPGLYNVSGCEYWTLNRTSGTGTPTVTLTWKNSDCPNVYVVTPTALRVASYNTTSSRWEDRGNGGVGNIGAGLPDEGTIVSSAGVSIFGAFALATSTPVNPLPIELVDFTAKNMGAFVALEWKTATEMNNDYFTIQRSMDAAEFTEVAQVNGAGNSREELNYYFNDENPLEEISYYRLKQTDFNNKVSYSQIVKVNRDEEPILMVSPNPMVGVTARMNMRGTFTIFNSLGQLMLTKENATELDVTGLTAGVYLIRSDSGQVCRLVIN